MTIPAKLISLIFGEESWANQFYGHSDILKDYVGVKLPYVIPEEIQHGWDGDKGISGDLTKHGEAERAFRHYVWNRRNYERCLEYGYKNVVAIGAPFLYLPLSGPQNVDSLGDKSLLLFPFHTYEGEDFIDPVRTYREYLEEIRELLSIFKPVTVCLYWFQHQNRDIVRLFEDKGIQVVTCGHRDNNPSFLRNFQNFTAKHAYVSSNSFGTAVFYALYMRKKVFLFGKPPYSEVRWFAFTNNDSMKDYATLYAELLWSNFDNKSHYWIGEKELGLEFKYSSHELRELFKWYPMNVPKQFLHRVVLGFAGISKTSSTRIGRIVTSVLSNDKR